MIISDDGQRMAFDKRELVVLTGMMAKDNRPHLAALFLHGGRAQAWATDGHRAVLVERENKPHGGDPKAQTVAIPAATALHAVKTASPRDLVVIDTSGPEVKIEHRERIARTTEIRIFADIEGGTRSKQVMTCKPHEGGFPTIGYVFPSHRDRGSAGAAVAFNPSLLAPLIALGSVTGEFVWVNIGEDEGPILFLATAEDGAVWRIVVMPKRAGGMVPPEVGSAPAQTPEPAKPAKRARRTKLRAAS